jgi:hypothetical protein
MSKDGAQLVPVADFPTEPAEDLRTCSWWRPRTVAIRGEPTHPALRRLLDELVAAFQAHGHEVTTAGGRSDILLAFAEIPDGDEPLTARIPESDRPLLLALSASRGDRSEHVVMFACIPERIGDLPHEEAIEVSRTAMARLGAPKFVFVTAEDDVAVEATFATLEGGHPTDRDRIAERLRDRLVAAACAEEVGNRYEIIEDAVPRAQWEATDVPEAIIDAGHRMDALGLLPPPRHVSEYVGDRLARLYARFLGIKGFSEGMLFAFDPVTETLMLTASGSWDVDKRALKREEVVPVGEIAADGRLRVLAPEGVSPKGPSVEALEMRVLLDAAPTTRLARGEHGWTVDLDGGVEAPIVRAGIHAHVGVRAVDPALIESLPANRRDFPYGFGCGTDLMCEVVRDVVSRSKAMNDPGDPRRFVRWPMLYHGDTVVELWKPGAGGRPLEGLLDLYESGAIDWTPDHITQPR